MKFHGEKEEIFSFLFFHTGVKCHRKVGNKDKLWHDYEKGLNSTVTKSLEVGRSEFISWIWYLLTV